MKFYYRGNEIILKGYKTGAIRKVVSGRKCFCKVYSKTGGLIDEQWLDIGDVYTFPTPPTIVGESFIGWEERFSGEMINSTSAVISKNSIFAPVYLSLGDCNTYTINITSANTTVTMNVSGTKNWGDGYQNTSTTHTYSSAGEYSLRVYSDTISAPTPFNVVTSAFINRGSTLPTNAFKNYWYLKSVYMLSSNITSIPSYAFYNCVLLKGITLPSSTTSIGDYAFNNCLSLETLYIPNGITTLSSNTLAGCTSLKKLTIPNSVTSLPQGLLNNCGSLEELNIPFVGGSNKDTNQTYQYPFGYIFGTSSYTGAQSVGQSYHGSSTSSYTSATYYIPSSLKYVNITGSNRIINDGAFGGCTMIKNVSMKNAIYIGAKAFYGCTNLEDAGSINSGLATVGSEAFKNCTNLQQILLPYLIQNGIGSYAFDNCYALLKFNETNKFTYGNVNECTFRNCESLGGVGSIDITIESYYVETISVNEWQIKNSAFRGCSSLNEVVFYSKGYSSIGEYAFAESGIQIMKIFSSPSNQLAQNGVSSIGAYAFYDCENLVDFYMIGSIQSIGAHCWENTTSFTNIYFYMPDSPIGDFFDEAWRNITKGTDYIKNSWIKDHGFIYWQGYEKKSYYDV